MHNMIMQAENSDQQKQTNAAHLFITEGVPPLPPTLLLQTPHYPHQLHCKLEIMAYYGINSLYVINCKAKSIGA